MRTLMVWLLAILPIVALSADPEAVDRVELRRHTAGTFYVTGVLDGYGELEFLLDTGSSYMVINQGILDRLKAAGSVEPGRELGGVMADGTRQIVPTWRVRALRLGQNCWIHDVEVAVFPGSARPILGMNILAGLAPFTFYAEPPQLGVNLERCVGAAPVVEAVERVGAPEVGPAVVPVTAAAAEPVTGGASGLAR